MQLSCGESTNYRQRETPKVNFGLSVAVRIQEFQLNMKLMCSHLCQECDTGVYPASHGNLFRLMFLLWAASHGTDAPWKYMYLHISIYSSSDPCLPSFLHYLCGSTSRLLYLLSLSLSFTIFFFNLSPSLSISVLGNLAAFNEFHCHDSTARSDPYHHFDCNTRSRGFWGDPTIALHSSATINYDKKPN